MSKRNIALLLGISAKLDSSVRQSFSVPRNELQRLEKESLLLLKKRKEAEAKLARAKKAQHIRDNLAARGVLLRKDFNAKDSAAAELAHSFQKARRTASRTGDKADISKAKELEKRVKFAEKEALAAEKAIEKYKVKLKELDRENISSAKSVKNHTDEIKRHTDSIEKLEKKSGFTRLLSKAKGFAVVASKAVLAIGAAAAKALWSISGGVADRAKEVKVGARSRGLSTDTMQGMQQIGRKSNLTKEQTDRIIGAFLKNTDEAMLTGKNKKVLAAMKGLGIKRSNLRKKSRDEGLRVLLDSVEKNKGNAKLGDYLKTIGGAGAEKLSSATGGRQALADAIAEGKENGQVMDKDAIDKSEKFDQAKQRLVDSFDGLMNKIGALTFEPLTKGLDLVTHSLEWFSENLSNALSDGKIFKKETWTGFVKDVIGIKSSNKQAEGTITVKRSESKASLAKAPDQQTAADKWKILGLDRMEASASLTRGKITPQKRRELEVGFAARESAIKQEATGNAAASTQEFMAALKSLQEKGQQKPQVVTNAPVINLTVTAPGADPAAIAQAAGVAIGEATSRSLNDIAVH